MKTLQMQSILAVVLIAMLGGVNAEATSLWQGKTVKESSLFVDEPALEKNINDIVFILVDETSKATATADTEVEVTDAVQGEISNWFSVENFADILKLLSFQSPDITTHQNTTDNLPKWGIDISNEFEGEADTLRNNTVAAKIAARVIAIRPNGNLVLEGKRQIHVNKENNILTITGVARPDDITRDNTIRSSYIADLRVYIGGEGIMSNANRRGLLSYVFNLLR